MTHDQQEPIDRDLLVALRRVADEIVVPPPDPSREAALLAAFDAAGRQRPHSRAGYWWMAALTTAATLLIVAGVGLDRQQARPRALVSRPVVVGEFVPWPGAHELPPLESGELLRVNLPVSMLPALGMMPPATHGTSVKADVIVGQDGLARAVRLVSD